MRPHQSLFYTMETKCLHLQWQTLAFPEAFYEKAIVLIISNVCFLKPNRMFILLLKKEQRAWPFAYIFWPICLPVGFIHCLGEALLGWRRVCCFLPAAGPTFWSTVRLEHIGWSSSAWGGVGKPHYFTYLFVKTWRELTVCLKIEMVVKNYKNIKKTPALTMPIKCL